VLAAVYACSTKKNTFVNRNFHALNTKFNVLFNGDVALEKGVEELKISYKDNFWDILPLERLDVSDEMVVPGVKKNPNFERAETKATKAIQKHSMNIDGYEYNYQMDEAHFTLGKSRYYDQRFLPALEAFNYVLYKYPNSSQIDEIKVWREKTNMRLGNNGQVLENIKKLIRDKKLETNIAKEAEALLAQTFINTKEFDSALVHIKRAEKFSKANDERARFRFIKGQLYDVLQKKDSAVASYNSVIQMKRKSPRQYVIHSHMAISDHFDYKNGDREAFVKAFTKLSLDKENKPYLGYINYHFGVFYDKTNQIEEAKSYYNKSLRIRTEDNQLSASNHRNLASSILSASIFLSVSMCFS
jgi:tetratricopeptide (TPR) repeat protein